MVLGRHPRTAAWVAAAVLVIAPVAAGCSDDSGDGGATSPPAASVSPAAPASAPGPADPAAAKAEIEKNWTTFFDPKASTAEKTRVLEDGDTVRPLLEGFATDPNAATSSARVTDVTFTSPTDARVTYDLLVGGAPALPAAKGTAVFQDQVWKVSLKTLCALVRLSGNAVPAGC